MKMRLITFGCFIAFIMALLPMSSYSQNVQVDVNLNMVHSVDGVSDFGRDRHITVHSSPSERDWNGQEDKLDYFINDLDVYWGRDNGAANWKFADTPEDPNRPNKPHVEGMKLKAEGLKDWYEAKLNIQQYEGKGHMIMGTTPHPVFPTLDWSPRGKAWSGWQSLEVETSAEWVMEYLDNYFAKNPGAKGELLPDYWEVVNEPDMEMMHGGQSWIYASSQEKIWEYHNLVAEYVKGRMGDKAPKIGGMCWGQHDFYWSDGIGRVADDTYEKFFSPELLPYVQEMTASTVNDTRTDQWYQWDVMWQGFIDECSANMDFHSIHIYDWVTGDERGGVLRTGGHVEAMLDMVEWYDHYKFGGTKDVVLSEFGSVSSWINAQPMEMKAWANLKPFNAMFMQFLERPSQVVYSMPFAPVKSEWGDIRDGNGNLTQRYGSFLMDRVDQSCAAYDESCEWVWSDFVKWYELWRDVDGTRIDTKADDRDIQVDAYVDGKKVYLILNNLQFDEAVVDLNMFDSYASSVESVDMRYMYFDPSVGPTGGAALDETTYSTAPGSLTIAGGGTVILIYNMSAGVILDETSQEKKYMCEVMNNELTSIGGLKFRKEVKGRTPLTTHINNVAVPSKGEAILRFSGKFPENAMVPAYIRVNGHELVYNSDWRGEYEDTRNAWFGTMEVDVPIEYLQANNEVVIEIQGNSVIYTSVSMQVFDMSTEPNRVANGDLVNLTSISLPDDFTLMNGNSEALDVTFAPANATNKKITWTSSNEAIVSVNEFGVVTSHSNSGSATITATSDDGNKVKTVVVSTTPYQATPITSVSIDQGNTLDAGFYITTPLTVSVSPESAKGYTISWASSNESIVSVDAVTGKISGQQIGGQANVTATVVDVESGNTVHTDVIEVTVGIAGQEEVFCGDVPEVLTGNDTYTFRVGANTVASRQVKVELYSDNSLLGSTTVDVTGNGEQYFDATLNLDALTPVGTDYKVKSTLLDGSNVLSTCESSVEITAPIQPETIELKDWLRVVQVGNTLPIEATVEPETAYDKSVNWEILSGSNVISIDNNGIITGLSAGTAVVRGVANGNNTVVTPNITITSQTNAAVVNPTSILLARRNAVLPNSSLPMEVIGFEPEWTTETDINWSVNNNLVSIDANGVVSASTTEGTVTVTATSSSAPSISTNIEVSIGKTIYVEAEDFDSKFGDELSVYQPNGTTGVSGINSVKTGNYVVYQVYFPAPGPYKVTFYAGTASDDAKIDFYVDNELEGSTTVNNLGWDNFMPYSLAADVDITSAGVHELGVVASGSSAYQWNLEHFELLFEGETNCQPLQAITLPSNISLGQCETLSLNYTMTPSNACNPTQAVWSVGNNQTATIDQNGNITGVSEGTTTVSLTTELGVANTQVTVTTANSPSSVTVSPSSSNVQAGLTLQLTGTILPANTCDKGLTWATSNSAVATVNQNGLVTIASNTEGQSVVITATSDVDNSLSASTTLQVIDTSEEITIEAESFDRTGGTFTDTQVGNGVNGTASTINWVNSGDYVEYDIDLLAGTYQVYYMISTPSDNAAVTISIDGSSIKTNVPNNGGWDNYQKLDAIGEISVTNSGANTIRVEATGTNDWQWNMDKLVLIPINISTPVTSVSLNTSSLTLDIDETASLLATIVPSNADDSSVTWSSDNTSIATVSPTGTVTAIAVGTATITVTTNDGNFTDNAIITVEEPVINVTGVTVNPTAITLEVDETANLVATVAPSNADDTSVTWTSDNTSVATVSPAGVVNAIDAGNATVTVTTNDGEFTATVDITVDITTGIEIPVGEFYIINKSTGEKLMASSDISGDAITVTSGSSTSEYARWVKVDVSGGYFFFKNVGSEMYIRPTSSSEGSTIIQRPTTFTGGWTQWSEETTTGEYVRLVNRLTGGYMGVNSGIAIKSTQNNATTEWIYEYPSGQRLAINKNTKISFYPNPVKNILTLSDISKVDSYIVYNLLGEVKQSGIIDNRSIDLAKIPNGVYMLQLQGQGSQIIKIIVQH